MVISQPPGNNPSYYYRASPTRLNCSECFQRHLMFYTCNYNIGVTHRNGAVSIFFARIRSTGGSSADCSLFILSLHALALHLAVKYYFKSFCMKIWARWPYIHLSVVFPSEYSRTALCYATNTIKWKLIPNIWHKSSTKHKEVRPDWNDKNDNANYAPLSYHMEGFYQWLGVAIFKEIFDQVRKDLDCELFYSELKRHNVSHYIY